MFLRKLMIGRPHVDSLVVVSPFIGRLTGTHFDLGELCDRLVFTNTPVFVITREPVEEYHLEGVAVLCAYDNVEVRYNPALHAKLYVCMAREESQSFAMFGSGNLTSPGVESNIELGMMLLSKGPGRDLVNRLYKWGLDLRTLPGTKVAKHRKVARRL